MRILLFSDVHLDSPFAWATLEVARKRRQALRDALARAIQLAIDQEVDAICCGGDLFEHDRIAPDTGPFLRAQFERVNPIRIFISPGNHDWLGRESLYRRTTWTPNVHIFERNRLAPVSIAEGLTLWGGAHTAAAGTPNFLHNFRVDRGGVHIALFHGSVQSAFYSHEQEKQPHAPFRAEEIEAAGLDFAMLGHYHAPKDAQRFTYPGNPEPLAFGETGPRGVVIVSCHENGVVTTERHTVAVSTVHALDIDVTGCDSRQEVRDRIVASLEGRSGYVRVTLVGELSPSVDLNAIDLDDLPNNLVSPPIVRIGSISVDYDLARIRLEPTVRGQFVRDVQASALMPPEQQRVIVTGLRALDGRDDLEVL